MKTLREYIDLIESATAPIIVPKKQKSKEKSKMAVPPKEKEAPKNPEDEKYSYEWYQKNHPDR